MIIKEYGKYIVYCDGYNRNSTEVFAERVEFLSGRKNSHNANVGEDYQEEEPEFTEMAQEEFPF